MATVTSAVTLNTSTYAALSSSNTDVTLFIKRGQAVRINCGASAPMDNDTAAYALMEGPSSNQEGQVRVFHFPTLSGANAYARLEYGGTSVVVITT